MSQDEPNTSRLSEIISTDLSLSGMVLKLVNSAAFSRGNDITSIQQGITLLGLQSVNSYVLAAALRNVFQPETEFQSAFFERANASARAAQSISKSIDEISSSDAYTAGLFHDAGALICEMLDKRYPQLYQHAHSAVYKVLEVDRQMYGTSHPVIGYLMAKHWKLPEHICSAILHSHADSAVAYKDSRVKDLVAILKITDQMVGRTLYPDITIKQEGREAFEQSINELLIDEGTLDDAYFEVHDYLNFH